MKHEIIPTILVSNRLEFVRRLGIMEGKIPVAQMDIMDGKFVANTTFADPKIAAKYRVDYELDLMVEDPEPVLEKWHDTLPQPPPIKGGGKVVRAFVHAEIKNPLGPSFKKIKSYGWEAGIAINPDTAWEVVEPFIALPSPPPLSSPLKGEEEKGVILKSKGKEVKGKSLTRREEVKRNSPPLVGGVRGGGSLVDCVLFMTVYPGQNAAPFQPPVIPKIKAFHAAHPNMPIEVDGGINENTLPQLLEVGVTRFAVGSAIWSAPDPLQAYKKLLKVVNKYR